MCASHQMNVLTEPDEDEYAAMFGVPLDGSGHFVVGAARPGFVRYKCGENETFAGIAMKFDMKLSELMSVNGVSSNLPLKDQILLVRMPKRMKDKMPVTATPITVTTTPITTNNTTDTPASLPPVVEKANVLTSNASLVATDGMVDGQIVLSSTLLVFNPNITHPLVKRNGIHRYNLHLPIAAATSVHVDNRNLTLTIQVKRRRRRVQSLPSLSPVTITTAETTAPPSPPLHVMEIEETEEQNHNFMFYDENYEESILRVHTRIHVLMMLYHQNDVLEASHPMLAHFPTKLRTEVFNSFVPTLTPESDILTATHIPLIARGLPVSLQFSDWVLLYSLSKHGISLNTFYRLTEDQGPTVIVIRASSGCVFGGFATESWRPEHQYYGSGDCFVFRTTPAFQLFPWSQRNEYFLYSTHDSIGMGGGGHFAFVLDKEFLEGSTGKCDTFDSPALTTSPEFRCVDLEVWGFQKPRYASVL
eukprot:c7242_g1_i1.p1 GENE.c7242_g1_i1~~c7242_g1_i1.p1  ORF type:complete len:475 (-),score=109.22 c7242_g1_i1:50-1474(-)